MMQELPSRQQISFSVCPNSAQLTINFPTAKMPRTNLQNRFADSVVAFPARMWTASSFLQFQRAKMLIMHI